MLLKDLTCKLKQHKYYKIPLHLECQVLDHHNKFHLQSINFFVI